MSATLGILGGGQLAMFMCEAARELGVRSVVLSPSSDSCARPACDRFIHGDYLDSEALQQLADDCDVVTLDNEHIPEQTLQELAKRLPLYPQAGVMTQIRDRLTQRGLLTQLDIPQVRFWAIDRPQSLRVASRAAVFPAVLKRRHGGYDGYGQARVATPDELEPAWHKLEQAPCLLEAWVEDVFEFSLVGVRGQDGECKLYPPIANWHSGGQLMRSDIPAKIPAAVSSEGEAIWRRIADSLNYRGVLTVEFFLDKHGQIMVNELAPRVHNSGHVTQLVSSTSQFKAHVCAVMGLPLPELEPTTEGTMWNLYPQHGINDPATAEKIAQETGGRILVYGKTARPRRKLGHWLGDAASRDAISQRLADRTTD